MKGQLEMELEIVELGNAKEETKGSIQTTHPEESPQISFIQKT